MFVFCMEYILQEYVESNHQYENKYNLDKAAGMAMMNRLVKESKKEAIPSIIDLSEETDKMDLKVVPLDDNTISNEEFTEKCANKGYLHKLYDQLRLFEHHVYRYC